MSGWNGNRISTSGVERKSFIKPSLPEVQIYAKVLESYYEIMNSSYILKGLFHNLFTSDCLYFVYDKRVFDCFSNCSKYTVRWPIPTLTIPDIHSCHDLKMILSDLS